MHRQWVQDSFCFKIKFHLRIRLGPVLVVVVGGGGVVVFIVVVVVMLREKQNGRQKRFSDTLMTFWCFVTQTHLTCNLIWKADDEEDSHIQTRFTLGNVPKYSDNDFSDIFNVGELNVNPRHKMNKCNSMWFKYSMFYVSIVEISVNKPIFLVEHWTMDLKVNTDF